MISPLIREYSQQNINQLDESYLSHGPIPKKKYWTRQKKTLACDSFPLVEATRSEMTLLPAKTPVSVLQELLSRRGTTPKYELVQIEGAIHEPTFRYRVTVADTVAIGTGRSKKEAKHAAAKNLLEKLIGNPVNDEIGLSTSSCQVVSTFDKITGNPIGTLQEMCISRRWPPPTYEMTCEEGLPHERQFTITCVVFKYREVGSGKSKKLAKRQAAYKMWERLQKCPLNPSQLPYGEGIDEAIISTANRYTDVKNSKISTLTTPHSHKVSTFHKNLKQSSGDKLNELQIVRLNEDDFNFVQFLQDIATEQQFEVTYVDIEEKSRTEKCQCLVQLSTLPVAVCYGSGMTSKEAQSVAAHNALEYLKIMTKK